MCTIQIHAVRGVFIWKISANASDSDIYTESDFSYASQRQS